MSGAEREGFGGGFFDFLWFSLIFFDFLRFSSIFCDFLRFSSIFFDFLRCSSISLGQGCKSAVFGPDLGIWRAKTRKSLWFGWKSRFFEFQVIGFFMRIPYICTKSVGLHSTYAQNPTFLHCKRYDSTANWSKLRCFYSVNTAICILWKLTPL